MPLATQDLYEKPVQTMELEILRHFLIDYLNRFEAYQLFFEIQKPEFDIAGQTRNNNTMNLDGEQIQLRPLLNRLGVPPHKSIGGDFIIGYDFENIENASDAYNCQIGLSIFDTANHGYEAFFLAGHIRAIVLNILDQQIRQNREIDNHIFGEINELLKGPIAQTIVEKTNPARASMTKGAVGIHGQIHREKMRFNFVCTGLPLFYYSSAMDTFLFLEPCSGPPLGYFNERDGFFRPYVPHSVKLHPGDYLMLATDGCFDSVCVEDASLPLGLPKNAIRHFSYPRNDSMEVMNTFDLAETDIRQLPLVDDAAVQSFCYVLEPFLKAGKGAQATVNGVLDILNNNSCFNDDDQSLIVVRIEDLA